MTQGRPARLCLERTRRLTSRWSGRVSHKVPVQQVSARAAQRGR
jgi:hypothetical protein